MSIVPLDEPRFLKVLLREASQKTNTKVGSTGFIFGTIYDSNDYSLAWTCKRENFLIAANNLGIKPQILGLIPWVPDVFDEPATLKRHLLALIKSEAQKLRLAERNSTLTSFADQPSYHAFVKKWNDRNPLNLLLYPSTSWINATNPPAAQRFNITLAWPNGTAAGADPPDFDPSDATTFVALDLVNFNYAVNKYGMLPELVPLRGKILDQANRKATNLVASWVALTTTSTTVAIENAAHELSVYTKAVASTRLDRTEHQANKVADIALLAHAASLFSTRLGPLVHPFISSLVEKKQYAQAFALLDTKFLELTHCHKVATILRGALGLSSTYSNCVNVEDILNTFRVLISRLEFLIHSHSATPAADRPSLHQIEDSVMKTDAEWTTLFPTYTRKVNALEIRSFLLDSFRGSRYELKIQEWSTEDGLKKSSADIAISLLSHQGYNNKYNNKASGQVRLHSAAFGGDEDDIDSLFRHVLHDPSLPPPTLYQAMLPPSSLYSSSLSVHPDYLSPYHDEEHGITAQALSTRPQKRCVICETHSEPKKSSFSHTHSTNECYYLKNLSSLTDQELLQQGFRPAAELHLPPYTSLYQRRLTNGSAPSTQAGAKRTAEGNSSVVSRAEYTQLQNELRSLSRHLPTHPPLPLQRFQAAALDDNTTIASAYSSIPPPRNWAPPSHYGNMQP